MTKFWVMIAVCLAAFAAEAAEEKNILHPHPVSLSPQGRGNAENNTDGEVKFKNPVFYYTMVDEKLDPEMRGPSMTFTPTTIEIDMREDGKVNGDCVLLANEENYIINECTVYYVKENVTDVYKDRYEINGCWKKGEPMKDPEPGDKVECSITEYEYGTAEWEKDKIIGWTHYVVTQPD